jgi:hypothetical protein
MPDEFGPKSTILLILGASKFPRALFAPSEAFEKAAVSLATYFQSNIGYKLPPESLISFFDSDYDPNTLDDQITTRIRTRVQQLRAAGTPARDLIVYYVGHGSFDEQRRYYLALKSTREENQSVSSLRVESLMVTLDHLGNELRKYVIIDACFAAEAAAYTQSRIETAVGQHLSRLPQKGTAFLCSSSRDVVSEFLKDGSNTTFTKALTEVLWNGSADLPSMLSLEDLCRLVERRLADTSDRFIRPEIHTPVQPQGDVANIALFPNGPGRVANAARERELIAQSAITRDYLRGQAEEQERRAQNLRSERRAQDEESRRRLLAEQERERTRQEQPLQRYDSAAEKRFREEAEQVLSGEANGELLGAWLDWKAQELRIQAGAWRQRARDHQDEAATNRDYAGNAWDNVRVQEKTGSDQMAQIHRSHWLELIDKAGAEEKSAAACEDQAEDSELASEYYAKLQSDAARVTVAIAHAQSSGRSFQESVERELAPILGRAHSRRRFRAGFWMWTRRVIITLAILVVLWILGKFGGN